MNQFNGYKIVENSLLLMDGEPYQVKRTWKERLFTRPWHPLRKTNTIIPQVPSDEIIIMDNQRTMVMHPEIAKALREHVDNLEADNTNPLSGVADQGGLG